MHLFICFFVTDFVCKMGACPRLGIEPFIPSNVQRMDILPNKGFPSSINVDFKRGCFTGDHSFKHGCFPISIQLRLGEFSLAQWLWYWLFVQASLVKILSKSYISAMHLFICFFVRKNANEYFYEGS